MDDSFCRLCQQSEAGSNLPQIVDKARGWTNNFGLWSFLSRLKPMTNSAIPLSWGCVSWKPFARSLRQPLLFGPCRTWKSKNNQIHQDRVLDLVWPLIGQFSSYSDTQPPVNIGHELCLIHETERIATRAFLYCRQNFSQRFLYVSYKFSFPGDSDDGYLIRPGSLAKCADWRFSVDRSYKRLSEGILDKFGPHSCSVGIHCDRLYAGLVVAYWDKGSNQVRRHRGTDEGKTNPYCGGTLVYTPRPHTIRCRAKI